MGKLFFTSDWHAGEPQAPNTHSYLRPYPTEVMLTKWFTQLESKITEEDTLYFVGDLGIQLSDLSLYKEAFSKLPNFKKVLIMGDKEYANKNFTLDEFKTEIHKLNIFDVIAMNIIVTVGEHEWFVSHKPSDCFGKGPSLCGHIHGCWRSAEMVDKSPIINVGIDGMGNPIENHPTWKNCKCPSCGEDAVRETDTMDTFVQSSWYFIRYISDIIDGKFDHESVKKWFPVDYYIGGSEHAISHMIFSRFFWRVFKKMGYIPNDIPTDPFKNVIAQGMVKKDGKKMSKSAGNGVSPNEMIDKWGSDTCRMYVIFAAPPEQDMDWSDTNIVGSYRFINKFWNGQFRNIEYVPNQKAETEAIRRINDMERKITQVYENTYKFNTIVSSAMEVFNYISKQSNPEIYKKGYEVIIKAISPIAPHICEEIVENMF